MEQTTTRKRFEREAEKAAVKVTGQKFCTACNSYRAFEGGKMIQRGNGKQWKCGSCLLLPRLRFGR